MNSGNIITGGLVIGMLGLSSCTPPGEQPSGKDPVIDAPVRLAPAQDLLSGTLIPLNREEPIRLTDYQGKVVLLDFWATWSAPSIAELPAIRRIHEALAQSGGTVIGLSVDKGGVDDLREKVRALDFPYPIGRASEETLASYGAIRAVPTRLLLDRDGVLRKTYQGFIPEETMMTDIANLLTE